MKVSLLPNILKYLSSNLTNFVLFLFISLSPSLKAEIEKISVTWNPQICTDACIRQVTKQLQMVGGIAEIVINQPQGQANIRWKPKAPFSYDYIKTAFGIVGATIRSIQVQVRGTLRVSGNTVILESLGDNTPFVLMGPAEQSFTKNIPQLNFDTHPLSPQMFAQLAQAAQESTVVTVKGPLLRPLIGLYLIVEQVSINRLAPR